MADDNEILSPPFPRDTTTVPRLLSCLSELRGWLLDNRYWANEAYATLGGEGDLIPAEEYIPSIPDLARYQVVSVQDVFQAYMMLRKLREDWDAMVRVYEENWNARPAVVWRLRLFRMAFAIMHEAFIDPETREARQETFARKVKKVQMKVLRKLGIDKEMGRYGEFTAGMTPDGGFGMGIGMGEPMKNDNIDFDRLFHGESSDDEDADEDDDQGLEL